MDKNSIKKYAVWARNELIARVAQKANQYGITEAETISASADSIHGKLLTPTEKKQRTALIEKIKNKGKNGFQLVMEEVAYTWFNRFTAIRFMEVNGYLPSHVRVFTDEENRFAPQILAEAIHLDMLGLDLEKVFEFKQSNKIEELYKYLIITQCNALNAILPGMFQKIEDYTELLLPDNLLREGSVIEQMITLIPEEDWTEQVEVLGWLYQYYISEKHDQIINIYKGTVKKEDIPAATQLFTTDWVVRYMVDNSLGRYWIERHPESTLADKLEFFVTPKDSKINFINETVSPQEMTFFDPCMGSGHILVYAFDVLMEIYRECGYSDRDAVAEIVQNNIFGLDIDDRCSQLAYFAVMMKARSYDRRFLTRGIEPRVYSIQESNALNGFARDRITFDEDMNKVGEYLVEVYRHAKEIGSIAKVKQFDYKAFVEYLEKCADTSYLDLDLQMWLQYEKPLMEQLAKQATLMTKKYAVVCTNPPYMGKMDGNLKSYVIQEFKPYSGDLFSVFIYHNFVYCKENGYSAFMTPFVWMFIQTYENLRRFIVENKSITTLIQMEYSAFEEATVPICSFVLSNHSHKEKGCYFRLSAFKGGMDVQRQKVLEAIADEKCSYFFETDAKTFLNIPACPIAYYAKGVLQSFINDKPLSEYSIARAGLSTGNNDKYMRLWFEPSTTNVAFNLNNNEEYLSSNKKFVPCNKGGSFRRWYGNNDYVVDWSNPNEFHRPRTTYMNLYYRPAITWSAITSGDYSCRFYGKGFLFDHAAASMFPKDDGDRNLFIGFMNTNVFNYILKMLNPTINSGADVVASVPICMNANKVSVSQLAEECIELSKSDWDSFETSWDFRTHPFVKYSNILWDATAIGATMSKYYGRELPKHNSPIELCYLLWQGECTERFTTLKENEEELNRLFIDIYGLNNELTPEVVEKDVTVRKADLGRDIRSFISYAVGCMFGRYSLNVDGITYAGGEWDESKYIAFKADRDNVLPICDDEYFEDDIVGKFVKFVEAVYGKDTLEENLKFIADALGGSGSPRDVIRSYFLNDFYADHLKIYQKRPIYWQFDSGKKNGFKCLIYMHRYQPDTIARIRTDYVHEQQARYRTAIADLEQRIQVASTSERVKLTKLLQKLKDQETEIRLFEEKVHHLADQMIRIDLDDGVKHNYEIFKDVLTKLK